jgi:hypothetical protein
MDRGSMQADEANSSVRSAGAATVKTSSKLIESAKARWRCAASHIPEVLEQFADPGAAVVAT